MFKTACGISAAKSFKVKYVFPKFSKNYSKAQIPNILSVYLDVFSAKCKRFKRYFENKTYEKLKNFKHWYNMQWGNLKKTIHHYVNVRSPVIS